MEIDILEKNGYNLPPSFWIKIMEEDASVVCICIIDRLRQEEMMINLN